MATVIDPKKKVKVTTREPFMTNGVLLPPGEHEVTMEVADDLMRRQHEFDEDRRKMLANNGENIDALDGGTLGG